MTAAADIPKSLLPGRDFTFAPEILQGIVRAVEPHAAVVEKGVPAVREMVVQYVYTPCATNGTRAKDGRCLVRLDHVDETGEQRWHAIGMAQIEPGTTAVLLVVHTYREDRGGEEIIRIISARRAERHEIRRYQAQAME
jgi:uncharacterized DUF497 family protein